MRKPALFAIIAVGTFNPAVQWAAASSTAQGAKSGPAAAVQQSSAANLPRRVDAKKPSSAQPASMHFAPHPPATRSSAAAAGAHTRAAHQVAARGFAAPVLGGRTQYDAKKGAVIGGPARR
jgi:hypothetical protein